MPDHVINHIYHKLTKDISDFKRSTGDNPKKILITENAYKQLRGEVNLKYESERDIEEFHGIHLKITDSINKDWIIL